jgi:TRAP transporter TAXI family solute receptor
MQAWKADHGMRKRSAFTSLAVVLGFVGLALGAVFFMRMPSTLTLAVGPAGLETHRYAEALAKASVDSRDRIRYRIVATSGAAESARLLEAGKVNLAIVRSDFELPATGQTLIVNAKRLFVVMAPQLRRGGVQKLGDLKGKRIAVARLTDPNLPLVRRILAVADIGEGDATLIECELEELPELLGAGKVDAAIAVLVPAAPNVSELIPQIAKRLAGGLRFIPLAEAEAIANRIIGVETAELPPGIFGAGRPQEEVATVAISYRTMARASMTDDMAGRVAKSLYELRTRLSRQVPVAFTAEQPDAKTGARLPAHPGAIAYFDGEAVSFLERYGEVILTVLWGGSLVGSAVTGLFAWFASKRHDEGGLMIEEIAALTAKARAADASALQPIEARADQIVSELARMRADGRVGEAVLESAALSLDHFRSVADVARGKAA